SPEPSATRGLRTGNERSAFGLATVGRLRREIVRRSHLGSVEETRAEAAAIRVRRGQRLGQIMGERLRHVSLIEGVEGFEERRRRLASDFEGVEGRRNVEGDSLRI